VSLKKSPRKNRLKEETIINYIDELVKTVSRRKLHSFYFRISFIPLPN
jgi:hypothetical protein